ncbi:MAG: FG-GAP repeat domain-containing protein [Granulosicoccus sp.]
MKEHSILSRTFLTITLSASFSLHAGDLFIFTDESTRLPADALENMKDTLDVELADIDSDGDLDLFVIEGSASQTGFQNLLWINDGHGNFADETSARLPMVDNNSTEIDLADVDGDGDLDALVANLGANQLLINDGHGVFTEGTLPQATQPGPPGFSIPFAPGAPPVFIEVSAEALFVDVDGDADQDIVIANENPFPNAGPPGDQNRLLVNDGSGQFSEATDRLPAMLDNSAGMAAGDINADGHVDLIVGNLGQNRALLNNGHGFFTDETASILPPLEDSTRKVVLGDADGDGDLDLLVGNSRGEQNRLYLNDGTGVFTDATQASLPFDESTSTDVDLFDFNGDGALDIFLTNVGDFVFNHGFLGEPNRLLLNDGYGRFSDATVPRLKERNGRSVNAELGDVNGDGTIDIVIGNSGGVDQPNLPPPDGAERLFIRKDCDLYTTLCHQTMLNGLTASIDALNTDTFPNGDMSSDSVRKNSFLQRRLSHTNQLAQRALNRHRLFPYWVKLWHVNLRVDGAERPHDWVLGGAADRIDDYSRFSLRVLYEYGL